MALTDDRVYTRACNIHKPSQKASPMTTLIPSCQPRRLRWAAARNNPIHKTASITLTLHMEVKNENNWEKDDTVPTRSFTIRMVDYSCLDEPSMFRDHEDAMLSGNHLTRSDMEEIIYPW